MMRALLLILLLLPPGLLAAERPSIDYLAAEFGSLAGSDYGIEHEGSSIGFEGNLDLGMWRVLRFAGYRIDADFEQLPGTVMAGEHYELGLMMNAEVGEASRLLFEIGVQRDWRNTGSEATVDAGLDGQESHSAYAAVDYRVRFGQVLEWGIRGQGQKVLHQRRRVLSTQLLLHLSGGLSFGLRAEQWRRGEADFEESERRLLGQLRWTF